MAFKLSKQQQASLLEATYKLNDAMNTVELIRGDIEEAFADLSEKQQEASPGEQLQEEIETFNEMADQIQTVMDNLDEYIK